MGLLEEASPRTEDLRRDAMKAPDDVSAMIRLKALGWGSKRIAAELGCSRNTVWRWVRRRLVSVPVAIMVEEVGRVDGLARRAISPSCWQRRRGAAGVGAGEGHRRELAHD